MSQGTKSKKKLGNQGFGITQKRELTPNQQKFCDNYLSGMSQKDAYVAAGYTGDPQSNSAITIRKKTVVEYLKEQRELSRHEAILSFDAKISYLSAAIEESFINKQYAIMGRLIEVANRMQGHNAAEITKNLNINVESTPETLQKIRDTRLEYQDA